MEKKRLLFLCLIIVAGVFLASCDDDEQKRAVVTVASINDNAPFFSDVLEQDTINGDWVKEDFVRVIFRNQPYNSFVTTGPDRPLSDFLVTNYTITWARTDGGTGVPPTYNGATSITVPSGELGEGFVVLVPYEVKNSALLSDINYNGANFPDELLMIANITFTGHEVGAEGRDQSFSAGLSVSFADPVIQTKDN